MINEFKIKQEICEIGHRLYAKGFAAANDGNISVRIGENEVLCTPTQVLARASEARRHLQGRHERQAARRHEEADQRGPAAPGDLQASTRTSSRSCTAIRRTRPPSRIAHEPIPQCVLPEVEVFLGPMPMTTYETPGGQAFADTILPFVKKSKVAILANHGTVASGETRREGLLVDGDPRRLLPHADAGRAGRAHRADLASPRSRNCST